ncbi:MAG TPA: hypothetical protein VI299_20010 [Polyangiales bacterium]
MRRFAITISLVFTGCPEASDPTLAEAIADSGIDGGHPNDDGGPKPVDEMDATVVLDATTSDAQVDAAVCSGPELVGTCSPSAGVEVRCQDLVCSGATPICCQANPGENVAPTCISAEASCRPSTDVTHNIRSECDDSADCQPGFVCIDGYNKGLGQRDGARCVSLADAYCGQPPRVGKGIIQKRQLCHADCECPRDQICGVSGSDRGSCTQP